ncbi:MAG TPA: PEP-CTERM sorting domain-containing protein [Tepidisphaeraceae bacterium]
MRHLRTLQVLLAAFGLIGAASSAKAQTVFGNFEDGNTDGFGYLSNSSGVQPFPASPGPTVSVVTPSSGDTTKVLDLSGSGYNQGQSGGSTLGYDFVSNGLASQFLANDILTFQWEMAPSSASSGYAQIYNIVLNAPGAGYTGIGGYSGASSPLATVSGTVNQNPGYTGQVFTVTINYDAYKALISSNPSYIQLGITTNNGGGAPTDYYFDNFTLSAAPEPASLGLAAIGGLALLRRRRKA